MIHTVQSPEGEIQHVGADVDHYLGLGWTLLATTDADTVDAEAVVEDGTLVVPLEVIRQRVWEKVKERRDQHRFSGCTTPKGVMDSDLESQAKVNGAVSMAMLLGASFSVDWTMHDNTVVTHNDAEMKAAGLAMGQFEATCHAVGQQARASLETMTREELEAFDPDTLPWPT